MVEAKCVEVDMYRVPSNNQYGGNVGHHKAYVAHDRAYVARSTSQGVRLRAYTPFFRCSVVARRGGPSIEPHVVRRFARALETLPIINNCIYGFVVGSLSHHASAREHIDREK